MGMPFGMPFAGLPGQDYSQAMLAYQQQFSGLVAAQQKGLANWESSQKAALDAALAMKKPQANPMDFGPYSTTFALGTSRTARSMTHLSRHGR